MLHSKYRINDSSSPLLLLPAYTLRCRGTLAIHRYFMSYLTSTNYKTQFFKTLSALKSTVLNIYCSILRYYAHSSRNCICSTQSYSFGTEASNPYSGFTTTSSFDHQLFSFLVPSSLNSKPSSERSPLYLPKIFPRTGCSTYFVPHQNCPLTAFSSSSTASSLPLAPRCFTTHD